MAKQSNTRPRANSSAQNTSDRDKDAPLKEDIRLLGRLLGDVLRDQEGDAVFEVVETIRQTAVRFRRESDDQAGAQLNRLLKKLDREQTITVVRAFSYFSHLANIAEDHHHNRRRRAHLLAGSTPQEGSVAFALEKLDKAGVSGAQVRDFFKEALISPVLTAHPTEVQRKSILDSENDIARLLAQRDLPMTPKERADNTELLHTRITMLWQTRLLRYSKLSVKDEVNNALSYYRITFLNELPGMYEDIAEEVAEQFPQRASGKSKNTFSPFVQMGSWIGGDRDGNPNVNADTMHYALSRQSTTVLDFYLAEVHALGAELSVSGFLAGVSPELQALAEASPDQSAHRTDEPYRRALIFVYTRLAATARARGATTIARREIGSAAPYASPAEFAQDLQILIDSLKSHHG
ncbi:MAG TPA: phosphoenolpyruvate carboxylase, partial [Oxalicibacterium sp.]|nr:phosphoenolpyruvate carboxylase [Oxalicibacterium sp.]